MALSFTLNNFPKSAPLLNESGLPWGCVVQPFISPVRARVVHASSSTSTPSTTSSSPAAAGPPSNLPPLPQQPPAAEALYVTAEGVARCESCYAYINCYANFLRDGWWCPLCYNTNALPSRYATRNRKYLPELQEGLLEFDVAESDAQPTQPVFIAVVDLTGTAEALETIKTGLAAVIQALPPSSLFGLVTFSDRIGVYDLRSPIPHIKHIAIPDAGECSLGLEELVPLSNSLVEISSYSEHITVAIEGLKSLQQNSLIQTNPRRGFGAATRAVVDFLDIFEDSLKNVRLMAFLCGIPNHGDGKLEETSDLSPQTNFYREQAKRAVSAGVCIDLYVVTNTFVGLSSLKFLTTQTGGNLLVYEEPEGATLPQDLYRQFTHPQASNALFRLRTSKELKTVNAYGHFSADSKYDNLFHAQGCDEYKCYAFDLEFTGATVRSLPTLQMAFSYTYVPSVYDEERTAIRRRLRVQTVQLPVAKERLQLYNSADPYAILCLLTHKLIRASLDEGVEEGQLLLKDWLVILLTYYNEQIRQIEVARAKQRDQAPPPRQIDAEFSKAPNLKKMLRFVYGLLKSPFLNSTINVDNVIYAQSLYSGLEARFLQRALYPDLSSWGAANNLSNQNLPLSKASIVTSGCRLFLIDGYHTIICAFYAPGAGDAGPEGGVFPPPKKSLLRSTIDTLRQERHIAPRVLMAKPGTPQETLFEQMLIEEGQQQAGTSYAHFVNAIIEQVAKLCSSATSTTSS